MPGAPEGPLVGPENGHRDADITHRRDCVSNIELAQKAHGLAGEHVVDDPIAHAGAEHTGADEVARPPFGHADPAGPVSFDRLLPHRRADLTLPARWGQRVGLLERTGRRPVSVEVAHGDEHGTVLLGRGQEGRGDRRPLGDPLVVWRVGAVVDGCRIAGRVEDGRCVRCVGLLALDSGWHLAVAAPGDGSNGASPGEELRCCRMGDRSGSDDDVC